MLSGKSATPEIRGGEAVEQTSRLGDFAASAAVIRIRTPTCAILAALTPSFLPLVAAAVAVSVGMFPEKSETPLGFLQFIVGSNREFHLNSYL